MATPRSNEIYAILREAVAERELVVIHSALVPLAIRPARLEDDLIAALRRLLDDGKTVTLPAFTFAFCASGWYHHQLSIPESGVLAQWFLRLPEVRRTRHPVYSFAVAGPQAERILAAGDDEAFGPGTVFEVFDECDACIVMLGASWQWCTQIHRYEELASVPYRHRMFFAGTACYDDGVVHACPRLYVRDSELRSVLNFSRVFQRARGEGYIMSRPLERGRVEAVGTNDLSSVCVQALAEDPYAVLDEPREVERRVAARRYLGSAGPPIGPAEVTSWARLYPQG